MLLLQLVALLVRFVHDRERRVQVDQLGTAAATAGTTDRAVVVVGRSGDRVLVETPTHGNRRRCDVRNDLLLLLLGNGSSLYGNRHWHCDSGRLLLLLLGWCLLQRRFHVLFLLFEKLFQLEEMAQLELFVLDVLPLEEQLELLPGAGH